MRWLAISVIVLLVILVGALIVGAYYDSTDAQ